MTDSSSILEQYKASIREEVRTEVREELRQQVLANLGGGKMVAAVQTATREALARKTGKAAVKAAKVAKAKGAHGPKRSPEEIAATVSQVLAYIAANPGSGAEAIKHALNVELATIELPIKKLLASKAIKRRGQKRATKYYPA